MGLIRGVISSIAHEATKKSHDSNQQGPPMGATATCTCHGQQCNICAFALPLGSRREMRRERRAMKHASKVHRWSSRAYPVMPAAAGTYHNHPHQGQVQQPTYAEPQYRSQQPEFERSRDVDDRNRSGASFEQREELPPAYERGELFDQRNMGRQAEEKS